MNQFIKKVPMPTAGVMLGMAALGNLLQSYGEGIRYACGLLSAFFAVLVILKYVMNPQDFKSDMNNSVAASVSDTFSMGIMLLSVYAKPFIGRAAFYIWLLAVMLHIILIVYFTYRFFIKKFELKEVAASYYIVYVGIVVASVTAPAYDMQNFGNAAFWFGLITFVLLFILVTIKYVKAKDIPAPAKPLMCIYTAPLSLCIAGYVQSVMPKSKEMLIAMFVIASIIYVFALFRAVLGLKGNFFPSFASFTFPFVISAIAAKMTMAALTKMNVSLFGGFKYLVLIETVIATALTLYTYVCFLKFIFTDSFNKKA